MPRSSERRQGGVGWWSGQGLLLLAAVLLLPLARAAADPPPCEEDITSQVVLTRTSPPDSTPPPPYVYHTIKVTNPGTTPIGGELVLAVDSLPVGVTFTPPYRSTECLAPLGSPTVHLSYMGLPGPLAPGAYAYASIGVDDPSQIPVTYTLRLLRRTPPTLSQLLPPTLPLMVGAVGTLTATLSSPLTYDTTLIVSSSRPAVASAPSSVPIPAGTTSLSIPVTARIAGTATVKVRLYEITAQTAITVTTVGPTISILTPETLPLTPGASGSLTVTLSAVPATDTVVALTSSDPGIVGLPPAGSVTVPAGQLTAPFSVYGNTGGTATVTASLNGSSAVSHVTVALPYPTVVSLLPPTLPLTGGSTGTLTVTLSATQPTATDVLLSTSDAGIVGLPADRVTIPANTLSAPITLTALGNGMATVTASLNGSSVTTAVTVTPPAPRLVQLACPATLTVAATGLCTLTLNAAQPTDTAVPLASSDETVLTLPPTITVPANALTAQVALTAVAVGSATVTAGPLNGSTQTAAISVLAPAPTLVSLLPAAASLYVGATTTLMLTLNATQLSDTVVSLTAAPASVLTVPGSVTIPAGSVAVAVPVRGATSGTATLTAGPLNNTQAQSSLTVLIQPPVVTAFGPPTLSLPKGKAGTLTVTISPAQLDATVVTLASSDPTTVEVPPTATIPAGALTVDVPVLPRQEGSATVTAGPLNGTSLQVPVTVTPAELVSLVITPATASLARGQALQFIATGTYTDASTRDLTSTAAWTGSDPSRATITSPGGVATALAQGAVTLTATVGSVSGSATLTVLLGPPSLTTFSPNAGAPGTPVTLTGVNLDATTAVLFNGMAAVFAIQSAAQLTATVPPGATAGPITVVTPGGTATTTGRFTVLVPPTLTITSPANGATINATSVQVRGTVSGATSEIGVSVNGVPAFVNSGQWVVEVPVTAGSNTLTALAIDATGAQRSASLSVTVSQAPPAALLLRAVPESGVAPLTVTWQVVNQSGRPLVQYEFDPAGTGAFGSPTPAFDGTQTTYTNPGLVTARLRATDDRGTQYIATATINVLARTQIDALLQAKWGGMKAALMANDAEGALRFITPGQQPRFRALFTALSGYLPQIGQDLLDIQLVYLVENQAKYRFRRSELYGGQSMTFSYYVYFIQDAAGRWSLEGF